jgi:arabinose-5-phosphate isomerase
MDYIASARQVMLLERKAIEELDSSLNQAFVQTIDLFIETLAHKRKIVVCGVGKSGAIAHKFVATLNSTGATAVVLDTQNALHGDLGMLDSKDVIIALSASGETRELLALIPYFQRNQSPLVSITGKLNSTLAQRSHLVLPCQVTREACPLNLAPTSSTTAMLVLCDALAMVLLEARGFQAQDFAKYHPGGSLGKKLAKVSEMMRPCQEIALVSPADSIATCLSIMTKKRVGAAIIMDNTQKLLGVFTHGDFVRAFQKEPQIANHSVSKWMTPSPVTIYDHQLGVDLLEMLDSKRVDDIIVINRENQVLGLIDSQDLSRFL